VFPHLEHGIVPSTVALAMTLPPAWKGSFFQVSGVWLIYEPLLTAGTSLPLVPVTATPPAIAMITLIEYLSGFVGV
jgi:hypothetical protein